MDDRPKNVIFGVAILAMIATTVGMAYAEAVAVTLKWGFGLIASALVFHSMVER